MGLNLDYGLPAKYDGQKKLHQGGAAGLAAQLRDLARRAVQQDIAALSQAALTDNSAGVDDGAPFTANATTDIITVSGASATVPKHPIGPVRVVNVGGGLPAGLAAATDYWLIPTATAGQFKVAASLSDAQGNSGIPTAINITSAGTGVHSIVALQDVVIPTSNDTSGGTTSVLPAQFNLSVDAVANAYGVLAERLNVFLAVFKTGTVGTIEEGPGTIAVSGTVAAIDVDVTVNNDDDDATNVVTAQAAAQELLNLEASLVLAINHVRRSVGLSDIVHLGSQGVAAIDGDLVTTAITNATADTGAVTSVLKTEVDAFFGALADNVAFLADRIDEIGAVTEDGPGYFLAP